MHTSTPTQHNRACVRARCSLTHDACSCFLCCRGSRCVKNSHEPEKSQGSTCVLLGPVLTHLATKRARGPCRRGLRWRPSRPLALALFRLLRRRSRSYSTGNRTPRRHVLDLDEEAAAVANRQARRETSGMAAAAATARVAMAAAAAAAAADEETAGKTVARPEEAALAAVVVVAALALA